MANYNSKCSQCVYDVQNHLCCKITCKEREKKRASTVLILLVCQKFVCTQVTLFPIQRSYYCQKTCFVCFFSARLCCVSQIKQKTLTP